MTAIPAIPERFRAVCALCSEPLDVRPGRGAYREETGWAPIREHGTNALALRQTSGRYAHRACVQLRQLESKTHGWTQLEMEL